MHAIFFQLPKRLNQKNVVSGGGGGGGGGVQSGEVASAQIVSSMDLHAVSHSMLQRLQNVIK